MRALAAGPGLRDISQGTKDNYRDDLRLHVRPVLESYSLGEITTGRIEWFLRCEAAVSCSRAHLRGAARHSMRPGEILALRPCDVSDTRHGMVAHVRGTVVRRQGTRDFRQDQGQTDASNRSVAVPEFAAQVLRRRMAGMSPEQREVTIFHSRDGGVITLHNLRRTFRDVLTDAGLADSGITRRWCRRTGATVLA